MITIERTVTVDKPIATVFDYLADFETTVDWDPGTVSTRRIEGEGGPGTKYANTSSFAGRETQLEYVVLQREEARIIQLRGENSTVVALDTMTFSTTGTDTSVTYRAEFTFKGLARVAEPFLRSQFTKLGDEAEAGIRNSLLKL